MDPITRDKIRFNPDLTEFAPAEHLDSEFGGKYKLKFDHPTYWDTLTTYVHLSSRAWTSLTDQILPHCTLDCLKVDKADQQAPDGTRVDDDGLRWYPPAGNGILAAAQGYFPRKGSVTPGDVTTNAEEGIKISGPDEGEPVPGVESRKTSIKSKSEKDIAASELSSGGLELY